MPSPSEYSPFYVESIYKLINQFNYFFITGDTKSQMACIELLLSSLPNDYTAEVSQIRELMQNDIIQISLKAREQRKISESTAYTISKAQQLLLVAKEKICQIIERAGINNYTGELRTGEL